MVIRAGCLCPTGLSLLDEVDEEGGVMMELCLVLRDEEAEAEEAEEEEETVLAAPCNRGDATGGSSGESFGVTVIVAEEVDEEAGEDEEEAGI